MSKPFKHILNVMSYFCHSRQEKPQMEHLKQMSMKEALSAMF